MLVGGLPLIRGGYVLDGLSALPAAAYSLRLMTASYKGKCVNVRRSSDNTAMDIGFRSGVLDVATLLAFVGSGNGFVTKWYNQGTLGSAGDVLQATAANQPQIVSGGVVETANGLPTLNWNSSGTQTLQTSANISTVGNYNLFLNAVGSFVNFSSYRHFIDVGNAIILSATFGAATYFVAFGATAGYGATAANALLIGTGSSNGSSNTYFQNGSLSGTGSGSTAQTASPLKLGVTHYGNLSEAMYGLTLISTTDRQNLEHNQEAFYGITGV